MPNVTIDVETLKVEPSDITHGSTLSRTLNGEKRLYWNGQGSYDIFLNALDEAIKIEYDNGRILGDKYAEVYTSIISLALEKGIQVSFNNSELKLKVEELKLKAAEIDADLAIKAIDVQLKKQELGLKEKEMKLREKEMGLKEKELILRNKQLEEEMKLTKLKQENIRAQTKVLDRQIDGFSDYLKVKLLEIQLKSFTDMFSSGMLDIDENTMPEVLKSSKFTESYNMVKDSAMKEWKDAVSDSLYAVERRIARAGIESSIPL